MPVDELARGATAVLRLAAELRAAHAATDTGRGVARERREARDAAHVRGQNVQYEAHHYEKEIQGRKKFRSAYPDADLGLATADLPEPVAERHAAMLRLLEEELKARQAGERGLRGKAEQKDQAREQVTERLDLLKAWERGFDPIVKGAAALAEKLAAEEAKAEAEEKGMTGEKGAEEKGEGAAEKGEGAAEGGAAEPATKKRKKK